MAATALLSRLRDVSVNPNASSLPGAGTLQTLTNGLAGWALMAALIGLLVGAALWAVGAHSQNYQQTLQGRRAVLAAVGAALVVGASQTLVNFFFHAGRSLH